MRIVAMLCGLAALLLTLLAHGDEQPAADDVDAGVMTARIASVPAARVADAAQSATRAATRSTRRAADPGQADAAGARTTASEVVTLDVIAITGNEELPRIMHIVPWKQADPGVLPGRPLNSLLNDIITPIDRHEYRRELRYHDALYGDRSRP
jgi:hypothetical protein